MDTYIFPTLSWDETAIRLGLAALLGAIVGFEREWRERGAGLRTHLLVTLGSAAITIVSAYGWHDYYALTTFPEGTPPPMRDPGRIAAQIVSGIGFLGGGVILRSGFTVRGLTTAASLWAMSGVGIAVGAGMFELGVIVTAMMLFGLTVMKRVNDIVYNHYHHENARVRVRITGDESLDAVMDVIGEAAEEIGTFAIESAGIETDEEEILVSVTLQPQVSRVDLGRQLRDVRGVTHVHVGELQQ